MRESDKSVIDILRDMLSKDSHKIWSASCAICSLSQNRNKINDILSYRQQIETATKDINLGGLIAPNNRFLKKSFEIMDFYENEKDCPCHLLGEDSNPIDLVKDEYLELMNTSYIAGSNYVVRCKSCGTTYKVEEREYHCTWWNWIDVS